MIRTWLISVMLFALLVTGLAVGLGRNYRTEQHTHLEDWNDWLDLPRGRVLSTTTEVVAWLKEDRRGPHSPISVVPVSPDQAAREIRRLLVDSFVVRNNPAIDLTRPIDWGNNPRKDQNWHFVLNKLPFLEPFLSLYGATRREPFYDVPVRVMLDWIDFNLDRNKSNQMKWNDMATGFRAVYLANVIDHELRSVPTDAARVMKLIRAAKVHLDFLRDPKAFALNNHGLFMMMGLKSLTTTIPELRNAKVASGYANERLRALLDAQFSPEGIHREHSPSYHLFVTQSLRGLDQMGIFDDEPRLREVHIAALKHAHEMFHPNQDIPLIGDSSGQGVQGLPGYVAYIRSDGKKGLRPPDTDGYYPLTGYAIFRSPWREMPPSRHSFLFFSAALHGDRAHAHPDFLTFEWSELGMPIIADSGKFAYGDTVHRPFFKSTNAGNTVEVDGHSDNLRRQDTFGSALRGWGRIAPKTRFVEAFVDRNTVGIRHTRMLLFKEKHWLLVVDCLQSPKRRTYREWFHFHEKINVRQDAAGFTATLPDNRGTVHLQEISDTESEELELAKGREGSSPQGWISRAYLKRTPRYSAAFTRSGQNTTFVTILSLRTPVTDPKVSVFDSTVEIAFTNAAGQRESFEYRPEANGPEKVRAAPLSVPLKSPGRGT